MTGVQACAFGHGKVVEALLNAKANINRKSQAYENDPYDWTPLATARVHGHQHVVDMLLRRGAANTGKGHGSPPPATY